MRTSSSASLPLVVERRRVQLVSDFYVPEIHAGVLDFARKAKWALFDSKCYTPSTLYTYNEPCDGILAIAAMPELLAWLKEQQTPVVRLLCSDSNPGFPAVGPNFKAIGVKAAQHFLSLGTQSLAFYRSGMTCETEAMWDGFSTTLTEAGRTAHLLDYNAATFIPHDERCYRRSRWNWLRDKLAALPRPIALLTEDDRFANDAIEAIAMLRWRIPEDVALLGTDNRELILAKLPIELSSVDSNLHGVGRAGAAMLERIMNGESLPPESVSIPPGRVVPRQSTATFVCDHPGLSTAVTYLRSRYHEGIRIEDICRVAGLSKRSLQIGIKEVLGVTISEELARLRLEHAARLLRETNLKLESVAFESGLRNARYLCEVFRREFHTTPAAYREVKEASGETAANCL